MSRRLAAVTALFVLTLSFSPGVAQPKAPSDTTDPDSLPQEAKAIPLHGGAIGMQQSHPRESSRVECPFRRAVRPDGQPLVIAHRGASGHLPEHTLAAYAAAYFMGADVIEPDVVLTSDGVLICSHDLTLGSTTDVALKFPGRAREDGEHYAIDFTLAEIKQLEKLGREDRVRQPGHAVATLDEMITQVQALNKSTGRTVGIIPEPKRPAFHRSQGKPIEGILLGTLARHGYIDEDDRCVVQCFDLDALERMRNDLGTRLPLAFLVAEEPDDATLERAAAVCSALGPDHTLLLEQQGDTLAPTPLFRSASVRGLALYPWTFGDDAKITLAFYDAGVDGLFTDFPAVGYAARTVASQSRPTFTTMPEKTADDPTPETMPD
jgi:glycerophosphoryl diester phosphodiesterase